MSPYASVKLGQIAKMRSGGTPPSGIASYYGGNVPWVSINDITRQGKYVRETTRTLTEAGLAASAATVYEPGVLLYAMYASLGECSVAVGRVSSSQAILGIEPGDSVDSDFLYYFLQYIKPLVKLMGQHGTQANLNAGMVRNFDIPLPMHDEQRAIASAIGEADEYIDALKRLIVKKRNIKLGMMQELLTGDIRLPGFVAEWQPRMVSDLLDFKNGLNKASAYFGHGTPIVNFMDVMRAPVITQRRVSGLVSLTSDELKRFSARRGDLFFTRTSETVDEVGTAAVLVDNIPSASFSGFVLRGRLKVTTVDPAFLAMVFHLKHVRKQIIASASYTTRALTNGRSLGRVGVVLPQLDEQRAIVTVLQDADAEIQSLDRRLASARAIKQGMMQELLSGRTRLPVLVKVAA